MFNALTLCSSKRGLRQARFHFAQGRMEMYSHLYYGSFNVFCQKYHDSNRVTERTMEIHRPGVLSEFYSVDKDCHAGLSVNFQLRSALHSNEQITH